MMDPRSSAFCGLRPFLGAQNGPHLEIHLADGQRFAAPGVNDNAHLG